MRYASPVAQAKRASPVDHAHRYILDLIMSGELRPGMRIPTEAIAEAISVSRMPVRDALRRLEGDGVVSIFANRGASVAEYSKDEITELIEMRAVLEGLAARTALANVKPSEIEELDHLRTRMERAQDDLAKWMSCHDEFHNYLTSLANRPLLMEQTERMRLMLRPYFRDFFAQSMEFEIKGAEHYRIVDALVAGDPYALEDLVRKHVAANVAAVAELSGASR